MTDSASDSSGSSTATEIEKKEVAGSAFSGLKSFISGGFGGICCVLVGNYVPRFTARKLTSKAIRLIL